MGWKGPGRPHNGVVGRVLINEEALTTAQVQNVSQSVEVLDLRTERDLQYVRGSAALLDGIEAQLSAAQSLRGLSPKGFQVGALRPLTSSASLGFISMAPSPH